MSVATAMILFPMVAKLFMQALAPIADAAGAFMKSKFKGRDFYVGLDWPFMAGCSEVWVIAIVLVPIELILAVVLSQLGLNTLIPLASIINVVLTPPAMIIARKKSCSHVFNFYYCYSILFNCCYSVCTTNYKDGC